MTKKQYYIPGKEYEWTKETWDTVLNHMGYLADNYGPFATKGKDVIGFSEYECEGRLHTDQPLDLCWEFEGNEKYWTFSVSEEGVEIPEYLIPFYGEKEKKEILTVDDLEAGKEYIMCLGVNEDRHIIYWAKNQEVIFVTDLLYHTYEYASIQNIFHFREVPEKTREQELSEKYNVSLDAIKKMLQDRLIKEEE